MSDALTARELFDETKTAYHLAGQNIQAEQEAVKRYLYAKSAHEQAEAEAFIAAKREDKATDELAKRLAVIKTANQRAAHDAALEDLRIVRGARRTHQSFAETYTSIGYALNSEVKMANAS